jgi:hypothetical protein
LGSGDQFQNWTKLDAQSLSFQEVTLQLEVNGVEIAEKLTSRAPWDIQTMEDEPVISSE